jgi:hypothetical protein
VQCELETCVFENLGSARLLGRERWDEASVREAGEGFYVVGVPSANLC